MREGFKKDSGFTLVETLCVIAIIIALALPFVFYGGYWLQKRFSNGHTFLNWNKRVHNPDDDLYFRLNGYTDQEIEELKKDPRAIQYFEFIQRNKERDERRRERQRETNKGVLNPDN